MAHVLGVSMPRSGHHLLEMILKNTLGDEFGYCEFYEAGCCKSIPCKSKDKQVSSLRGALFFQKSHDFDLSDPIIVPETFRVVQYRNPVPRSLSNYELYLRNGYEDNVETFCQFLVDEALYFCKFYKRWIETSSPQIFTLSYEELTTDPFRALLQFFQYVKLPVNLDHLSKGIAQSIGWRGRDNTPFVPAEVSSHRYSKDPVLANFEQIVLANCPGYFPPRYFSSTDADSSLIGKIFYIKKALQEGDCDIARSLADAAYEEDPRHPVLRTVRETIRAGAVRPRQANESAKDLKRESGTERTNSPPSSRKREVREDFLPCSHVQDLALGSSPIQSIRPNTSNCDIAPIATADAAAAESTFSKAIQIDADEVVSDGSPEIESIRPTEGSKAEANGLRVEPRLSDHSMVSRLECGCPAELALTPTAMRRVSAVEHDQVIPKTLITAEPIGRLKTESPREAVTPIECGHTDKITSDDVVWCYRSILGREPESPQVVQRHLAQTKDFRSMVLKFINSLEYQQKKSPQPQALDGPPTHIEIDASEADILKLRDRIRTAWTNLGATRPHHSVLTRSEYLPQNMSSEAADRFWASGLREVGLIQSILKRHGFHHTNVKDCVEYGCGVGRVTVPLATVFRKVNAYDISQTHLDLAVRRASELKIENIKYHLCLVEVAEHNLDNCDFFYSRIVFQHNPPPIIRELIKAALASLRAGGMAIFQVPTYNPAYSFRVQEYFARGRPPGMEMHCIPQAAVFSLVNASGCRVLEVREDNAAGGQWLSNTFAVARP
jgi:SAM-dependent methyltransferase